MAKDVYADLDGRRISLASLDSAEKALVASLQAHARLGRRRVLVDDWNTFDNYSMGEVGRFYDARGLSRKEAARTAVFQIALDLSSRLGIAAGMVREPDYRDDLEDLIRDRFRGSHRAFCKATGLSEDMLSHVLAGRKDFSLEKLTQVLNRIGYRLQIAPTAQKKRRTG